MDDTNNIQRDKQGALATDRGHLTKLCSLDPMQRMLDTRYSFVAEELLKSLCCVHLGNIDIDINRNDCTVASTYFQPCQPLSDEFKQTMSRVRWDLGCPGEASRLYPEFKGHWFMGPWCETPERKDDELQIDLFGGSAWRCIEDRCHVRDTTGLVLPMGFFGNTEEFSSDFAFFPKDEKKPHLACIMSDTLISGGSILRSEIFGAFYLVTYQLAIKSFCGHRIKPVILYTFQGDDYARITQAYWDPDMGKIVIRQSRQLDLRGPKPTEDGWLLMRWMLNTPVGDTVIKLEDGGLPVRAKEPAVSPLKPTTANIVRKPNTKKLA